jgi:hypothetical protein
MGCPLPEVLTKGSNISVVPKSTANVGATYQPPPAPAPRAITPQPVFEPEPELEPVSSETPGIIEQELEFSHKENFYNILKSIKAGRPDGLGESMLRTIKSSGGNFKSVPIYNFIKFYATTNQFLNRIIMKTNNEFHNLLPEKQNEELKRVINEYRTNICKNFKKTCNEKNKEFLYRFVTAYISQYRIPGANTAFDKLNKIYNDLNDTILYDTPYEINDVSRFQKRNDESKLREIISEIFGKYSKEIVEGYELIFPRAKAREEALEEAKSRKAATPTSSRGYGRR